MKSEDCFTLEALRQALSRAPALCGVIDKIRWKIDKDHRDIKKKSSVVSTQVDREHGALDAVQKAQGRYA
jgi:hypothetical protein